MKTILIVEDEQSDADQLVAALKPFSSKISIMSAGSGKEAMECLKKKPADLVLLDISLPGYISGSNLLFRQEFKELPVILVSKMEEIDLKVMKVKFQNIRGYITKPVDAEALRQAVSEALGI
ncbi:MAG: response regulator [Candidatus Eremiobacteraeota bacterium]|nr:response regulator [Candidatus Eremiobacteraeota bacterium]